MSHTLALFVSGKPAPKYGDRPKSYTAKGAKAWAEAVQYALRIECTRQGWELERTVPVRLDVVFFMPAGAHLESYPTIAPDVDKLLRMIGDCGTGIVYRDDAQVVMGEYQERYARYDGPFLPGAALRYTTLSQRTDEQELLPLWCAPTLPRPLD